MLDTKISKNQVEFIIFIFKSFEFLLIDRALVEIDLLERLIAGYLLNVAEDLRVNVFAMRQSKSFNAFSSQRH